MNTMGNKILKYVKEKYPELIRPKKLFTNPMLFIFNEGEKSICISRMELDVYSFKELVDIFDNRYKAKV